ncbi:MAG: ferrous iron transport protein A, partial [Halobacteria archaeon]|nr:ferrous iron transport protein A [Halobacteria archaeon]
RVSDQDEEVLRYLSESEIKPGKRLEVVEVAPIGMVVVEHEDGEQSLPEDVAEKIMVRPAQTETSTETT